MIFLVLLRMIKTNLCWLQIFLNAADGFIDKFETGLRKINNKRCDEVQKKSTGQVMIVRDQ